MNSNEQVKVTTVVNISYETIADLLCSAFEGGSNYWYTIADIIEPLDCHKFKDSYDEYFPHMHAPLSSSGKILIYAEGDQSKTYILNLNSLKRGLKILAKKYPHHFNKVAAESGDADTADAFLQCCLFGDIIYG